MTLATLSLPLPVMRRRAASLTAIATAGALAIAGYAAISPATASAAPAEAPAPSQGAASFTDPEPVSPAEYEAALERLRQRNAAAPSMMMAPATASVGPDIAKMLGEAVFRAGAKTGMGVLVQQLGLDSTGVALEKLQSSMNELSTSLEDNKDRLKKIDSQISWSTFDTADGRAKGSVAGVKEATATVTAYEKAGVAPKKGDLEDVYKVSKKAVYDLSEYLVDDQIGSVWHLQDAASAYGHEEAWNQIDGYRSYYRAVLAQAVVNLEWAMQYDEITDDYDIGLVAPAAVSGAEAIVDTMYERPGVAYPQPTLISADAAPEQVGTSIHLNHAQPGTMYAAYSRPRLPGEEGGEVRTGDRARAMYTQLSANYDKGIVKGGRTFQQYLNDELFPTTTRHANTFSVKHQTQSRNGMDWFVAWVSWDETRVQGDNVVDDRIGSVGPQGETFEDHSKSVALSKAGAREAELYDAAQNRSPYKLTVPTNKKGYAISDDESAVEMARSGLVVERDTSGVSGPGELGAITVENLGGHDRLLVLDGVTGHKLGNAKNTAESHAGWSFDAPESGYVTLALADDVAGEKDTFTVVGSTVISTEVADANGKVSFSEVTFVEKEVGQS